MSVPASQPAPPVSKSNIVIRPLQTRRQLTAPIASQRRERWRCTEPRISGPVTNKMQNAVVVIEKDSHITFRMRGTSGNISGALVV